MKGDYYFQDEAYIVIDAQPEKHFVRYILQKNGEKDKNYLIISEKKG